MSDDFGSLPLPHCTAKYTTDLNNITEAGIRGMICNPVYTGIPPYQRIIADEMWIQTASQMIKDEGAEQFLVNMLYVLRNSMVDIVPDEAIPADYDGPWPNEEAEEDEIEDFSPEFDDPFAPPSPWRRPMEGLIFCSHDDSPMIILDGDFFCVSEYLYAHLGDSRITDLITEPVLALVFQNGHTLPLLCPGCGQSLHTDDFNKLLDNLNGLSIAHIEWDHEDEALMIEFNSPENDAYSDEPPETLFIHLDSAREMTCPHQRRLDDEAS